MSGWLSSVNNLLENLDGQAETVAETVAENATTAGISKNLMKLNKTLTNNNIINNTTYNEEEDEDYDDDDDAYDDEDFFGDDEEFTTTDDSDDDEVEDNIEVRKFSSAATPPVAVAPVAASTKSPDKNTVSENGSSETETPTNNDINNNNINSKFLPVNEQQIIAPRPQQQQELKELKKQVIISKTDEEDRNRMSPVDNNSSISDLSFSEADLPEKEVNVNFSGVKTPLLVDFNNEKYNNSTRSMDESPRQPQRRLDKQQQEATPDTDGDVDINIISNKINNPIVEKDVHSDVPTKSEKAVANPKKEESKSAPPLPPRRQASPKVPRTTVTDTIASTQNNNNNITTTRVSTSSKTLPTSNGGNNSSTNVIGIIQQQQQQQQDELKLQKHQQQLQQVSSSKNRTIQSLQSQLSKVQDEISEGKTQNQHLSQRVTNFDEKLRSSEQEIEAQAEELRRAGEEIEKVRTVSKEEREDLLDDHDEELEEVQREHQLELDKTRQEYERTIADWTDRFESEESLRQQQGGDSIKELRDVNQREKDALKQIADLTAEKTVLQTKLDLVVSHETELQQQVESSLESTDAVTARETRARDELDKAAAIHAKQMAQRQRRETELEQTILELGSALTLAKQQQQLSTSDSSKTHHQQEQTNGLVYKEQLEQVAEELETVRVKLTMETQRREALQQELNEVSNERKEEVTLTQARQHQHDRKVADLESTIHRLQASVRAIQSGQRSSNGNSDDSIAIDDDENNNDQSIRGQPSQKELEGAKREISKLSEKLLRHQGHAENAKSEILTLKGRLQAANNRAEEAEKYAYSQNSMSGRTSSAARAYDMESGGSAGIAGGSSGNNTTFSTRKRVKGGSRGVRSIRSALPCFGPGRGSTGDGGAMNQVALTVDAIDSWMVDTGSFMRHEPFARLGLLLYLIILHLWSFALVVFHTTEVPHGDFGSMDSNPTHWREHVGA